MITWSEYNKRYQSYNNKFSVYQIKLIFFIILSVFPLFKSLTTQIAIAVSLR